MAERGALPDSTQLLERDREFDQLASALRSARDRHGMVALVSGEAGIGKTTLVRRFLRTLPGDIRALAGSCEDLIAARVLGPFREMLPGTPMGNADAAADLLIAQAERAAGGALVAVVDDVQWADDASLDVIRYIGRRIGTLSLLLVVIFRTEQEPENARLRRVLGALSGSLDAPPRAGRPVGRRGPGLVGGRRRRLGAGCRPRRQPVPGVRGTGRTRSGPSGASARRHRRTGLRAPGRRPRPHGDPRDLPPVDRAVHPGRSPPEVCAAAGDRRKGGIVRGEARCGLLPA